MIRILHVEPDVGIRTYIKQHLEEADPELLVESIVGSVDNLTNYSDSKIDVILLCHSHFLNALELTKKLRNVTKVPIIIYTTENMENISNQVLDVDADAYLMFKLSPDEYALLVKRIRLIVEKSREEAITATVLDVDVNAIAVEQEGEIFYCNSIFEKLVSESIGEIKGKSISYFVSESERSKTQKLLQEGGEGTVNIVSRSGEKRSCKTQVTFTYLLGKKVTIVLFQDATLANLQEQRYQLLHEYAPKILDKRTISELVKNTLDIVDAYFDSEIISFMIVEGEDLVCLERRWKARSLRVNLGGESSLARSAREGRSYLINDFSTEKPIIDDIAIKSELSVPIKNGNNVVAVLDLRSSKVGAFTDDDVKIIEILCLYVGCTFSFISELQSFRSSETQYRRALETLGEAIYVISDSHYSYVNQRGVELLGYAHQSELLGKDVYLHIAPESKETLRNKMEKWSNDDSINNYKARLVKRDGSSIEVVFNVLSIVFGGKPAYLVVEKDVINQKLMQDQIKKYTNYLELQVEKKTRELLEAQQFVAAGKLASMVGHDLRSPLQSIRNATYLVRRQPERSEEMLSNIEASVDRALSMLEDLRYQSMATSLKIESTDLHNLIMDILREAPVTGNIEFDVRLDPELKVVEIDSLKMRRVIDNLVRNAIEAMPGGGKLIVETKSDGDQFIITVTDTGVGISKENFPNLFKPYYTTKSKGLGLGLAYSQKAVEAHGGIIGVESTVGNGTVFKILMKKRPSSPVKETSD